MSISLDEIFVQRSLQMLGSVAGVLKIARTQSEEIGISESDILAARLAEDMWPLPNQIQSLWVHSAYVVDQVKNGEFRPNINDIPSSWDEMDSMLIKAQAKLLSLPNNQLEKIADQSVNFVIGGTPRFKASVQDFLLSFSLPNVHFHATTAYDILRSKGIEIGKFDFLGQTKLEKLT